MSQLPKLIKAIRSHGGGSIGLSKLSDRTGVSKTTLRRLKTMKKGKYRSNTLDPLYYYFDLDRDDFYNKNLKKRYPPTFSIIGNILRNARIYNGWSIAHVAHMIKGEKRQIFRIEAGDSLPSYNSWYMTNLLKLYGLEENDEVRMMWGVNILKDLVKLNNKYETMVGRSEEKDEKEKGHGKKTVVQI